MGILPAVHGTPAQPHSERGQSSRDEHDGDHADERSDETHLPRP